MFLQLHTSNWLNSGNIDNTQLDELAKLSQNAKLDSHTMGLPSWAPFMRRGGFNGVPWLNNFGGSYLKRANKIKRYALPLKVISVFKYKMSQNPGDPLLVYSKTSAILVRLNLYSSTK